MREAIDRRAFLGAFGAAAGLGIAGRANALFTPTQFIMWHSPGCGCCIEWSKRMGAAIGRKIPVFETSDLKAVKRAQRVPEDLQSCHTAIINGYVVEGHVPPVDIRRLVATGSRAVRGLAVPGMPHGTPGMDMHGGPKQPFRVIAFADNGQRSVFSRYG